MIPLHLIWLILLFLSSFGISISDLLPQLCWADDQIAAPNYIVPCWNSTKLPHVTCCKAGDKCLDHGACYNSEMGNTYMYGCTDSSFDSDVCPRKCHTKPSESNWVGLVYCDGTDDTPKDEWICVTPSNCGGRSNCPKQWDPRLQKLAPLNCSQLDSYYFTAFKDKSVIDDIGFVPDGSSLEAWYSKYADRWNSGSATTSILASQKSSSSSIGPTDAATKSSMSQLIPSSAATTDSTAQTASPSTPQPSLPGLTVSSTKPSSSTNSADSINPVPPHDSSSSRQRTIAMAVGLGGGIPVILGVAGFILYCLRKRRSGMGVGEESHSWLGGNKNDGTNQVPSNGAYTDAKAELPAGEIQNPLPEMEGSTVDGSTSIHSPLVSPLLSQCSTKDESREHRALEIQGSPVYELPG